SIISSSGAKPICAESCEPMLTITTTSERTGRWTRMHRPFVPFSVPEPLPPDLGFRYTQACGHVRLGGAKIVRRELAGIRFIGFDEPSPDYKTPGHCASERDTQATPGSLTTKRFRHSNAAEQRILHA